MSGSIILYGTVRSMSIDIDRSALRQKLSQWDGKPVELEVRLSPEGRKRSAPQARFYFGPFVSSQQQCFKERMGLSLTKGQVHEFNKSNLFANETFYSGEVLKTPRSTTTFTTREWEESMEMVRQYFLTNFDWILPVPNEQ